MDTGMMQDRLTDSTTVTLLAELKPRVARYTHPVPTGFTWKCHGGPDQLQNTVRIPCS